MLDYILLILLTCLFLLRFEGRNVCGQNTCLENGTSVTIQDKHGTIQIPKLDSTANEAEGRTCYWEFESNDETYGIELTVDFLDDAGDLNIQIEDKQETDIPCTKDSYCLEKYTYEGTDYNRTCFKESYWFGLWSKYYCLAEDNQHEPSECVPCDTGTGSKKLKPGRTYCYNNCKTGHNVFGTSNKCDEHPNHKVNAYIKYDNKDITKSFNITYKIVKCSDEAIECFTKEDKGASYRGKVNETKDGEICQRWDSQVPHSHKDFNTPQNNPDSGLDENYCRNPDNKDDGPWCYTTDTSKRWQYCPVPECSTTTTSTQAETTTTTRSQPDVTSYRQTTTQMTSSYVIASSQEDSSIVRQLTNTHNGTGKQVVDNTLLIAIPIVASLMVLLLVISTVIWMRRRRRVKLIETGESANSNIYGTTASNQTYSQDVVDNVLYDSFQAQGEKQDIDNVLYGTT